MTIAKIILPPARHGRLLGVIAGVAALVVVVNSRWSPNVDPLMPVLPPSDSEMTLKDGPRVVTDSVDFIFRPLFMPNRTQPASRPDPAESEETTTRGAVTTEGMLEGYKLLGVFSSGGVAGAILGGPDGARQRLAIGESLEGWVLDEAASRSVRFSGYRGSKSILELAVASELPVPKAPSLQTLNGDGPRLPSDLSPVDAEMAQGQAQRPVKQPLTFESVGNQKRDEAMARKASAGGVSGSSE
jgi:hypothetical protein